MGSGFAQALTDTGEQLTQQEAAVMQGTGMAELNLPNLKRKGGKLEYAEGLGGTGFEDQFPIISDKYRSVMEAMREGLPDLSVMNSAEREIAQIAEDLRAGVSGLVQDKESGFRKGSGQKLFQSKERSVPKDREE